MTIAAGFVCCDGLVLFADTEEQQGYTKTNVEKIQHYPYDNCRLLIANAGHGYLADSLIDRIFDDLSTKNSDEATIISSIRNSILQFHESEVALYPADNEHKQVNLILGLQVSGNPILLHADSTAMRKVREFAVAGYGAEIKFLAQQLYRSGMPVKHGVLIANYLVETAKRYVQGCGGESRIATLNSEGVEILHNFDVWDDQRLFWSLAANYRAILLSIGDEDITDDQFDNCVEWFVEEAWKQRSEKLRNHQFNREFKKNMEQAQKEGRHQFTHYYEPPPTDLDIMDRRRDLPKYKFRIRSSQFTRLLKESLASEELNPKQGQDDANPTGEGH